VVDLVPSRPRHGKNRRIEKEKTMTLGKVALAALVVTAFGVSAEAQDLTGTLKKIKETGTITIGYRESSVPFSYLDDSQKPIGFAMDICGKIVDAVKAELKNDKITVALTPVTSATRIPLIANGTVDLECGSTTNNVERQKQVSFAPSHFLTANRFVSKKTNPIKSIEDLKGKTIVSTSGTTNIKQVNEVNAAKSLGINIIAAKDHAEAFLMVETDRAMAFAMDDILLAGLVAGSKAPSDYVISDLALSKPEPYGIMLRREDPAFKALVDKAVGALYTSADMPKLFAKWFQSPIPPKNLNLNVPLGDTMKKAFAKPNDSGDPDAY
jgi:glutamate/aspartate transport system substrate-binding protein